MNWLVSGEGMPPCPYLQTNLVRQEEKYKLERRLVAKESELSLVRNKLQEVRSIPPS